MNKAIPAILLFIILAAFSCRKAGGREETAQTGLTGSWIANDYIADPGNGDVTWHPVTDGSEVISFDQSGKGTIFSNGVQSSGYYQVTGDSTMDIVGGSISASFRFTQNKDTLTIAGACIETCVTRYLRGKQD